MSRQAGLAEVCLCDEPPEYTLLMLMPPRKAVWPSTISGLRWSRWLIAHSLRAINGLSGLNFSTITPLACNCSNNAAGVLMVPTLSRIR